MAPTAEPVDQRQNFFYGLNIRVNLLAPRAKMHMNRAKIYRWVVTIISKDFNCPFDIDAKFCCFLARGYENVSFIIDVGIDTQGNFCLFTSLDCQLNQVFQLRFRFDVEIADSGI